MYGHGDEGGEGLRDGWWKTIFEEVDWDGVMVGVKVGCDKSQLHTKKKKSTSGQVSPRGRAGRLGRLKGNGGLQ